MKITAFLGSPRKEGNTSILIREILAGATERGDETKIFSLDEFNAAGASENKVETHIFPLNDLSIKGCQSCYYCHTHKGCAINDDMQQLYPEIRNSDTIIIGSPVYLGQMTAQTKLFMDRLYPLLRNPLTGKKDAILVFTQHQSDFEKYKEYFEYTAKYFDHLGFNVNEILVGISSKKEVREQTRLLKKAKDIGKDLVK